MEKEEIVRFIQGLQKKHGNEFSLKIKYLTNAGKTGKRHGRFVGVEGDKELVLLNQNKGTTGRYLIERVFEIERMV